MKTNPVKLCKILMIIILLGVSSVYAQEKGEVILEGIVDTKFDGTRIYLYNNITGDNDTATVRNGKFQIIRPFTEPTRHMLSSEAESKKRGGYRPFGILIDKPGKIVMKGDLEAFYAVKVSGSGPQAVLDLYNKQSAEASKEILKSFNKKYGVKGVKEISEIEDKEKATRIKEEYDAELKARENKILSKIIAKNPNSIASTFLLNRKGDLFDPEEALVLFEGLTEFNKETYFGRQTHSQVQGALESRIGSFVKDFILPKDDGNDFSLSELKGNYVLLDFWASWCMPCIEEFKTLRTVYEKYEGKKPFKILGISTDKNEKAWRAAMEREKLPWTQVHDNETEGSVSSNQFAVKVLPTTFILDPSGKIIQKNLRGEALVKWLEEKFGF